MRSCLAVVIGAIAAAALSPASVIAQPAAPVRLIAEWEPAVGTIISWPLGIPSSLVVELARDDTLFVLVTGQAQENQAKSTFLSWGVDLAQVEFIHSSVQTMWPRDWGPHQVFDANGTWSIMDFIFQGYPWVPAECQPISSPGGHHGDNAVNQYVADHFGAPLFSFPGYLTGGNFLVDGHRAAFSTCAMVGENQQLWTEQQFLDLAELWLGVSDFHIVDNTENVGIQHIDCWFKPLDEETLLVKRAPAWHEEYNRIENNVQQLASATNAFGRPYKIIRIECPPYDGERIAAYSNSLILNGKVFVPLFNIPADQQALQTFREALPGHEVIGFPWGSWYYFDALHCRARGLHDRHMLRVSHRPLDDPAPFDGSGHHVEALIIDHSQMGLIPSELLVYWRADGQYDWSSELLSPAGELNVYEAWIPAQPSQASVEYYISAGDNSGRRETSPRMAPDHVHRFTVADHGFTIQLLDPPLLVAPGVVTPFEVVISPQGETIVAGSTLLHASTDGVTYHAYPLDNLGGNSYTAWLPRARCEEIVSYYVEAEGSVTGLKRMPPLTDVQAQVGTLGENFLLNAGFEGGLPSGWNTTGLWHVATSCSGGSPCDGVRWAYFGQSGSCTYATGGRVSGSLASPLIELPQLPFAGRIELEYCSRLVTENREGYDVAGVYVDDIRVDVPDESNTWQSRRIDLTAFAGRVVQLSWRFDSIDNYYNGFLGWQVDGVRLTLDELECVDTCLADLNGDGVVDQLDLAILLASFGINHKGDTNSDGQTDQLDLARLLSEFNASCF